MIIGPVTDLRNYRDYTNRFKKCLEGCVPAAEVHLIRADLRETRPFVRAMTASAEYFRDQGLEHLSYHLLDDVINDLILHGMLRERPAFQHLLPDRSSSDARDMLDRMLEGLNEAAERFGRPVITVVHEGIFLEAAELAALGPRGAAVLLDVFDKSIASIHCSLFSNVADLVMVFLENSPLHRGMCGDSRHITDQSLCEMIPRLAEGEALVLDVSHRFLYERYAQQDRNGETFLDGYEDIRSAITSVGWVHLNDCSAANGGMEGMPLFQPDSLIEWERLILLLLKIDAPMILEIEGAEKDFSIIERSLSRFLAACNAATEDGGKKQ